MNLPEINIEDDPSPPQPPPPNDTPRSNRASAITFAEGEQPRNRLSTLTFSEAPEERWRRPSIRVRRLSSTQSLARPRAPVVGSPPGSGGQDPSIVRPRSGNENPTRHLSLALPARTRPRAGTSSRAMRSSVRYDRASNLEVEGNRRRSSSDPQRVSWAGLGAADARAARYMPDVSEEGLSNPFGDRDALSQNLRVPEQTTAGVRRRSSMASVAGSFLRIPNFHSPSPAPDVDEQEQQYNEQLVDVLDTVDPEISTLSTLTNVQNSLFVPDLGRYINRRPTYTLSRVSETESPIESEGLDPDKLERDDMEDSDDEIEPVERMQTTTSLTSRLDSEHYAVLPPGERLKGWTEEEIYELNDHVRHMLHSRREKFKRGLKGFGQYVRKPLGFLVTLYAVCITVFGLAWVLFLIGWINVGGRKDYIINVIDNVLVALFAIMGDGLAPFRAVDTYHMIYIAHYYHLTWRLRKERALPKLRNRNSLPDLTYNAQSELEAGRMSPHEKAGEYSVLTPAQRKKLVHHQKKFSRSHTFYKPHETETHYAFPLRLLVAIVVLLDCHSLLQISLGTCTWAISYHVRPFALTTVILCFSITCNITAGVLISVGDHKTRKKDVIERMFRQDLTAQAMKKIVKKKEKLRMSHEALERPVNITGSSSDMEITMDK